MKIRLKDNHAVVMEVTQVHVLDHYFWERTPSAEDSRGVRTLYSAHVWEPVPPKIERRWRDVTHECLTLPNHTTGRFEFYHKHAGVLVTRLSGYEVFNRNGAIIIMQLIEQEVTE